MLQRPHNFYRRSKKYFYKIYYLLRFEILLGPKMRVLQPGAALVITKKIAENTNQYLREGCLFVSALCVETDRQESEERRLRLSYDQWSSNVKELD